MNSCVLTIPKTATSANGHTNKSINVNKKKQMQCCLQLQGQFGEPLQGQQIHTAFIGVTAMAEALQLFELRWTQTTRASCQVGLLQGLTSQAPAAFSPSDNPGRRVR